MFIFRGEGEGEGGISLRLHEYVERERRGEQRRKERHKMVTVNKPISKVPGMILILIAALLALSREFVKNPAFDESQDSFLKFKRLLLNSLFKFRIG